MALFDLNLDTLGAGVRGLLENPALTRLAANRERPQPFGDYASAQGSLWDQHGATGPAGGNLFAQAGLGGDPFAQGTRPVYGSAGSSYDRLARVASLALSSSSPLGAGVGKGAAVAATTATVPQTGTSTGLTPGVAKWADQTRQTFGDLGADMPDTMLAIMTNESGGDPNAYNAAGDAWGLFQNVGLGSNDPNAQFAAARTLAQQKLASIQQSYAANGLNPDERTRARDFALAWAGHYDYGTGRPNPSSRDVGSGQTADQLSAIFLGNYDRIKAGRQQPQAQGGGAGLARVTGGQAFPIMQGFGVTDYATEHPDTYAYANSYGLVGSQHPGIDWAAPMGTQVYTPLGGTVSIVGNDHGSGYYYTNTMSQSDPDHSGEFAITLDNGDVLILGHLANINAQVGQRLDAGALIGLSGGSDGAHVHVEYRQRQPNGGYQIIDPRTVLGG